MSFIHNNKNRKNILIGLLTLASMVLFVVARETVLQSVSVSLDACAGFVIPAIFPFLVLSYVFMETPCALLFGRFLRAPGHHLWKLSPRGMSVLVLGMLSGFPVGAKCAVDLYRSGKLAQGECERLSAFANCPSPAFVIGVVGGTLYRSVRFGLVLYGAIVGLSLLAGAILTKGAETPADADSETNTAPAKPFPLLLCTAIGESALAMVKICAFVVFFGAAASVLLDMADALVASAALRAAALSFFEFSRGCSASADLADGRIGAAIAAFALGWGGLSVQAQVASFAVPAGISMKTALSVKFFIGISAAFFIYLVYPLCGASPVSADLPAVKMLGGGVGLAGVLAILIAAALYLVFLIGKRKKSANF